MRSETAAAVRVGAIKVTVPLKASALPVAGYPVDGTAPPVRLDVSLEDGGTLSAELSGRSFRRVARLRPMLAAGHDPVVILQGALAAGRSLYGAGLAVVEPEP